MSNLYQQLAYQYDLEKTSSSLVSDSGLDSSGLSSGLSLQSSPSSLSQPLRGPQQQQQQQQHSQQRQQRQEQLSEKPTLKSERDLAAQQRENKLQLQQHEREQHLHQLQSINNLLLDLPTPSSPSSYASSKFSHEQLSSPSVAKSSVPANIDDISISELFGLGLPRGSLMGAGQKEQAGQSYYESSTYPNYHQQREDSNTYHSNLASEQYDHIRNYYSNANNMEVPSSPVSAYTPASPSSPGSIYSNSYSYSSVNSSPYTSGSSVSNSCNKLSSPSSARSPSYGRPIRGCTTPYSDCSSPFTECPPRVFGCNGSRSDSPADSDKSSNNINGPLSDIMGYLSTNTGPQHSYPPHPTALLEAEKYLNNGNVPLELKKFLQIQQHKQTPEIRYHHHHAFSRNHNQQRNASRANSGLSLVKYNFPRGNVRNLPLNSTRDMMTISSNLSLDKAAKCHRNAAAVSDATYTWSGVMPQRTQKPIGYSSKVFLGGVPWDVTEPILYYTFRQFGQIKIEWPKGSSQPKGYCYVIFESEKQVKALLNSCVHDFSDGGSYYYKITSKRIKGKQVQVIPWALDDSNYVLSSSQKLDPANTVFVGALHGMITALGLATIMNDLFDNVIYAGIDTDKFRYPIGSARVTFSNKQSYNRAIHAAFIEIKSAKFGKIIQVDPYIEDAPCSVCYVQQGPYFCKEKICFRYYCHTCWQWIHSDESGISWHYPLSRGLKNNQVIGLTPNANRSSMKALM